MYKPNRDCTSAQQVQNTGTQTSKKACKPVLKMKKGKNPSNPEVKIKNKTFFPHKMNGGTNARQDNDKIRLLLA